MNQLQSLMKHIIEFGEHRETRSGLTQSVFDPIPLVWNLQREFPVTNAKKLPWKAMVGELLWFLNGETTIPELRKRSNLDEWKDTIWCPDSKRWGSPELGLIYGYQWRELTRWCNHTDQHLEIDQIANLIDGIKSDPYGRRHIVSSWNVFDIDAGHMALEPCHCFFQCYVSNDGYLDIKWYQRSWDVFLGAPFNISSYALLLMILAELTGLKPRKLSVSVGDAHIYQNQMKAVNEYLTRRPKNPKFKFDMPKIETLEDLKSLTAEDFPVTSYTSQGTIKAPVSVG